MNKVGSGRRAPPCFWQLAGPLAVLAAAPGGQGAHHTLLGVLCGIQDRVNSALEGEWSLQGRAGSLSPVSTKSLTPFQGLDMETQAAFQQVGGPYGEEVEATGWFKRFQNLSQ